ncbi:MAG: hypothetical protein ABI670_21970 [Chloroflexota bacterium]
MAQVNINDVIEYPTFRKNPGPLLNRAAEGRPLLLIKGRERLIVVDAEAYEELVRRAERAEHIERPEPLDASEHPRTGTNG